jgi:hypothetical protein
MAKMIQVRNVPPRVHGELTRRAKSRGQTLTRYVEEILEREIGRPAPEEVFARIRALPKVNISGAEIIRQVRAERDKVIARRLRDSMRRRPAR